jgi:hypothetical protein
VYRSNVGANKSCGAIATGIACQPRIIRREVGKSFIQGPRHPSAIATRDSLLMESGSYESDESGGFEIYIQPFPGSTNKFAPISNWSFAFRQRVVRCDT